MSIQTIIQQKNAEVFERLASGGHEKTALDPINDFTRTKMREDGFYRRVIPPMPCANDELDRQYFTDKPSKVIDKEPDAPAAISIPFATQPRGWYIVGPRYLVSFARIATTRFSKDVEELRTWTMDIRQVLTDNAIKDMLAEEDAKFIGTVNTALISPNVAVPWSGRAQWVTIAGGIDRDTVQDAFKVMPSTNAHLEVAHVLCNNVTIREVLKWRRDEVGGDLSQDLLTDGFARTRFMNAEWSVTIKRDLVPDATFFMFADPKFIGKNFTLEDTVMYIKRDAFMLEFFAYESIGGTLGHTGGLARVDFQ